MKIDKGKLRDALDTPEVQRNMALRRQIGLQAGLCSEFSALGLMCTLPVMHLDREHVAHGEHGAVLQRWPR